MPDSSRRKMLGLAAMAPLAGALLARGAAAAPSFAPPAPRERIRQRYLPNVQLVNQDNEPVRFYDDLVKDKIVTINFFYAKCEEICPVVIANLARVQKILGDRVGREIFMSSISLRPETDTPEALKAFSKMHGAGPGWNFLTGARADIELLRRSLGFTNPDANLDKDVTQHIGNVRYGNEPLMLWAACPGLARPEWIAESISWMIRPEAGRVAAKS